MPSLIMHKYKALIVLMGLLSVPAFGAEKTIKIGILGDVHGELEHFQKALQMLKAQGVTHIIGTGDFVRWEGVEGLRQALAMITPNSGVSKDNIYLLPGNWEH